MSRDEEYWWTPKRYGFGTGWPITWQAWVSTLAYVGLVIGAAQVVLPLSAPAFAAIMVSVTAAFVLISARKTRGGWRWRWGKVD